MHVVEEREGMQTDLRDTFVKKRQRRFQNLIVSQALGTQRRNNHRRDQEEPPLRPAPAGAGRFWRFALPRVWERRFHVRAVAEERFR